MVKFLNDHGEHPGTAHLPCSQGHDQPLVHKRRCTSGATDYPVNVLDRVVEIFRFLILRETMKIFIGQPRARAIICFL